MYKAFTEEGAFCCKGVEVGGLYYRMAYTAQAVGAELVGEDEEDVLRHRGFLFNCFHVFL